jgi:hypothetical protein
MRRVLRAATYLAVGSLTATGAWASDAPVVTDSLIGAQYIAEMPSGGNQGVIAQFSAASLTNGKGVSFAININGAELTGGPFRKLSRTPGIGTVLTFAVYHIHQEPVPSSGNCTATLGHLDPYARGDSPPCNADDVASCQIGDLSGKHGTISTLPGFSANYSDPYLSLTPGAPGFFGNRSIVLHYSNLTRIACANFKLVESNSTSSNGSYYGGGQPSSSSSPSGSASTSTKVSGPSGTSSSGGSSVPSGGTKSAATGLKMTTESKVILGPILAGFAMLVL